MQLAAHGTAVTVETVDDFFANVAKEAAEKFPDLGIVVVELQEEVEDAKICSRPRDARLRERLGRPRGPEFSARDVTDEALMEPLTLVTFGYKNSVPPRGATVVVDCRELRNPHSDPKLRDLDGRDVNVQTYVALDPRFGPLMAYAMERARFGGTIAFGCYGGRHRSVAMAELVRKWMNDIGYKATIKHNAINS